MLERLRLHSGQTVGSRVDPTGHFALARVSLDLLPAPPQPAGIRGGQLQAVMDGQRYAASGESLAHPTDDSLLDAAAVPAAYAVGGINAIDAIEGSFAVAMVDLPTNRLTLISDRFGTRPIYYAHTKNRFLFASTIAALLADADISRTLDSEGISQFFTFGHYLGDSTSIAAVRVLPAGAVLKFDAKQDSVSIERYWHGAKRIGPSPGDRQTALDAIGDAFVSSVRARQSCPGVGIGLSLSGGLDARTILGTFDHSRNTLTTVCMGMRGSHDHHCAAQLARIVGCPHHNHILDSTFLANFRSHLDHMVQLTDGQYLSQCIIMPTLPLYRQLGVGVLLRGHAGELLHLTKAYNYSLNDEALQLRDQSALEHWLWRRLQAHLHDGVAGCLFARPELRDRQLARESLRQAVNETPCDEHPAQRIAHLFLDQRVRRETMLSMMKFRSVVEPRLPYLDRTLVERLLAIPVEWKLDDELQTHILRRWQPRFCDVVNTNTGAALGAGQTQRSYAKLRNRVLSKLGVPGYQPYERLGLWLRRDLATLVRSTLLSDTCLDRGIFLPETIRRVVDHHLTGQRNHTYLIMAMLVFEVGHRWLLDDQALQNDDFACIASTI